MASSQHLEHVLIRNITYISSREEDVIIECARVVRWPSRDWMKEKTWYLCQTHVRFRRHGQPGSVRQAMEATRNKAHRAKYCPQKRRRWAALEKVHRKWISFWGRWFWSCYAVNVAFFAIGLAIFYRKTTALKACACVEPGWDVPAILGHHAVLSLEANRDGAWAWEVRTFVPHSITLAVVLYENETCPSSLLFFFCCNK